MATFFGAVAFIAGIALIVYSFLLERKVKRYEFENITDGGVVKFSDFKASQKHGIARRVIPMMIVAGIFLSVIGFIVFSIAK